MAARNSAALSTRSAGISPLDHLGVLAVAVPDDGLHRDEVDHAAEIGFGADRKLQRHGARAELVLDVGEAHVEVGAGLIHLVGEDDARHAVLVALAPDGLGLRLDALVAVEHADGAVEHAQRTLDLDGEVDVAWRVDDVQAALLAVAARPEAGRRSRRDRDAALGFLIHEIHGRGAVVDFADLVGLAGVIEDPLGRRRLAGIDVSHDAEVAVVLDGVLAGHVRASNSVGLNGLTSGNARRRGWLPPSCACLRAS